MPSTAWPLEHVVASTASPSTSLDHFTVDLDRFTQSTPPPPTPEHAVDLDYFAWSTLPPLAPEHVVNLDCFARSTPSTSTASSMPPIVRFIDAPEVLHSTLSFPSLQVIHEELANYCRIQICDKVPT
jgi:hypothetical protein